MKAKKVIFKTVGLIAAISNSVLGFKEDSFHSGMGWVVVSLWMLSMLLSEITAQ
jgi:hypothetical protein